MRMKTAKMLWGGRERYCYSKLCDQCGCEFYVPKHVYDKTKFCGSVCSSEARKKPVTRTCDWCDSEFSRSPSKSKNSRTGLFFCSRECKETAQSNLGKSFDGFLTPAKASRRVRRAGICNDCGYDEVPAILQGHHIDGNRRNNSDDNLICLCPNCHAIRHLVGGVVNFKGA